MLFEEQKILAPLTTFRVGGPARFFRVASNDAELAEALAFAEEKDLPYFILGEGSNILVSDAGVNGLVLKLFADTLTFEDYPNGRTLITAHAGAHWDTLVRETVTKNLCGVENLSWIPGTAGAAPVQNIGAYGAELADTLEWVETFDARTKKKIRLSKEECGFGYRDSIFKKKDGARFVITRIALALKKNGAVKTDYKDVREYFKARDIKRPALSEVRDAVIAIRAAKLPDIAKVGTAGSFFKNPIIPKMRYEKLRAEYLGLPGFALSDGNVKISLAWVIDRICGMKGARRGGVGTHEKQSLVIVNYGGATAREIKAFADEITRAVKEKTGITPEYEVALVGNLRVDN